MKKGYFLLSILISVVLLGACSMTDSSEKIEEQTKEEITNSTVEEATEESLDEKGDITQLPVVTMKMEEGGEVELVLYPQFAPNTVNNFIALIKEGFYDGLTFHRVLPNFMIQGGDPQGNGTGSPGYSIKGEFSSNDFPNELKHERGVLSMARSGDPNSAGSQFFITVADSPHLDGDYAAFGEVIKGMDVIDRIVVTETDASDKPVEDQVIQSMTVELNEYDYKEPEKIK